MTRLGLPVPPGFVITTQVCRGYLAGDYALPEGLASALRHYNTSQPAGLHLFGKRVSLVGSILPVKRRGYSFCFRVLLVERPQVDENLAGSDSDSTEGRCPVCV